MSNLHPGIIETLHKSLTILDNGCRDFINENDGPKSGSQAEREMSQTHRSESIVTAVSISYLLIEYNGEHLSAFLKILREPIEHFAAWTCVRSMLESSALASWMVDPNINYKERIARQFAHRYEGLNQLLRLAQSAAFDPAKISLLKSRIDQVESDALALGYSRLTNSKNKLIGIARQMPNATDLIGQVLGEEEMYRLLSAVAHGHAWAHIQLGFKPVQLTQDQSEIGGITVQPMEKQVLEKGLHYLGLGAAKAFAQPIFNYACFLGWNVAPIIEVFEEVYNILQVKDDVRFWRDSK